MKFQPEECPECGEEPVGTVEKLHGLATLTPDGLGGYEYSGSTEVWWNEQKSVTDSEGRVLLQCEDGHEWYAVKA